MYDMSSIASYTLRQEENKKAFQFSVNRPPVDSLGYVHPAGASVNSAFFEEISNFLFGFYNDGLWENIFWCVDK